MLLHPMVSLYFPLQLFNACVRSIYCKKKIKYNKMRAIIYIYHMEPCVWVVPLEEKGMGGFETRGYLA